MNKVMSLLKSAPSVEAKATAYEKRIRENLEKEMIQPLKDKISRLETQIEDQLDFSLDTDLNKGVEKISRPEVEARVRKAIELKYDKSIIELELKLNQEAFNELFSDEEA